MKTTTLYLFLILFFSTTIGVSQGYYIKDYDVSIDLKVDGTFSVKEELDVFFTEERRGIIRSIPTRVEVGGERYSINIDNIEVSNWKDQVNRKNGTVNIRIGDPNVYLTGDQKYIIEYDVNKALIQASDHIEFYWNITGNEWDTQIQNVSFEIRLPEEIGDLPFEYVAYSGREGTKGTDVTIDHIGRIIAGNSTQGLFPYEGITMAVNLPQGFMSEVNFSTPTTAGDSSGSWERKDEGSYPFLPAAFLAFLFGAYRRHGVNTGVASKEHIPPRYYPPESMNPAEVGTFYDFTVHSRDLISLIPKWGNQGCVEVRSIPDHKGEPELYFYKIKDLPQDTLDYEYEFFNALFKDGDQVFIGDLKNKFYQDMSKTKSRLKKEVKDMELYDQSSLQYFKRWPNIVGFILTFVGGLLVMGIGGMLYTGGLMVAIGIVLLVFLIRKPKMTERGVALHNELRGFHKFLKDPNPNKLNQLIDDDQGYLEKVFPYVVAFGLDKTWNKNIANQYPDYTPPPWYYYQNLDGTRNTATSWSDFGTSFDVKSINSVFSSAPQSSGSSGGFSGGSSGGGFGGGGGSSW